MLKIYLKNTVLHTIITVSLRLRPFRAIYFFDCPFKILKMSSLYGVFNDDDLQLTGVRCVGCQLFIFHLRLDPYTFSSKLILIGRPQLYKTLVFWRMSSMPNPTFLEDIIYSKPNFSGRPHLCQTQRFWKTSSMPNPNFLEDLMFAKPNFSGRPHLCQTQLFWKTSSMLNPTFWKTSYMPELICLDYLIHANPHLTGGLIHTI